MCLVGDVQNTFSKKCPTSFICMLAMKMVCVYTVHRARAIWTIDPGWTNWKLTLMIWHLTVDRENGNHFSCMVDCNFCDLEDIGRHFLPRGLEILLGKKR